VLVPADLDGAARLHAVDLEAPDQRFRLRDRYPDRPLWAWVQDRPAGTALDPPRGYELGELPELRVTAAVIDTEVRRGDARITDAWLRTLDPGGAERARGDVGTETDPLPVSVSSEGGDGRALEVEGAPGWLAAGATLAYPGGRTESVEVRWMVRARDGHIDVIGPGFGYRLHEFPDARAWLREDVSARLSAELEGLPAFEPVRRTERFR
jgi:hypothetical protein